MSEIDERLRFFKARAERLKDERDQLRSDVAYQGSTILMLTNEKAALERRIDELCAEVEALKEREQNLVTLLRNDCDIEASWDGLRKFWYIGLTESGCLMRDRACKAEAENVKLRDENAKLVVKLNAEHIVRQNVEIENDRLREQVDYMTPIALYEASERERDRMRELGIEVD